MTDCAKCGRELVCEDCAGVEITARAYVASKERIENGTDGLIDRMVVDEIDAWMHAPTPFLDVLAARPSTPQADPKERTDD